MNTSTRDLAKMKQKIAMLLAKAENTPYPAEAEAFSEAAEKLMLRLGIARAELESVGETKPEKVGKVSREYKGIFAIANVTMAYSIATGFGHITGLQSSWNRGRNRTLHLIGVESDLADLTQLLDSLEMQALAALATWRKETADERRYCTAMEKELRDRSFLTGFGSTVGSRLRKARTVEEQSVKGTGTELVLVGKAQRVADYMAENYPNLRKGTSRQGHSYAGSNAGRRAGENANLGQKGLGNRKAIGA